MNKVRAEIEENETYEYQLAERKRIEEIMGQEVFLRPSEWVAYKRAVDEYNHWQRRMRDPDWIEAHGQA